ncbi:hypothetical protein LPTSP1_03030 [Leptospira johnsonii]|uniref:Uncharacterized protein n=1 Tax=Leptospira johnsonii TaxID=1917820 RepID=A0A2P2CY44_9LEPT|nr:hypothetical protein LPTSP1_03030 [Leptospira johnsonii]
MEPIYRLTNHLRPISSDSIQFQFLEYSIYFKNKPNQIALPSKRSTLKEWIIEARSRIKNTE